MASREIGHGPCKLQIIGAIILKFRHHFEIPLLHGNNPFRNVAIETTPSPDEAGHVTTIPALARQLSDSLTAATASGELSDPWRMVAHMSFHDAIQVLQQASSSTSE